MYNFLDPKYVSCEWATQRFFNCTFFQIVEPAVQSLLHKPFPSHYIWWGDDYTHQSKRMTITLSTLNDMNRTLVVTMYNSIVQNGQNSLQKQQVIICVLKIFHQFALVSYTCTSKNLHLHFFSHVFPIKSMVKWCNSLIWHKMGNAAVITKLITYYMFFHIAPAGLDHD